MNTKGGDADGHKGWGRTIYKHKHTDWRGDAQVTKRNTHNFGTFRALYIENRESLWNRIPPRVLQGLGFAN